MVLILILNMLFAITFVLAKASVLYMNPLHFLSMRMLVASGIMLLCSMITYKGWTKFLTKTVCFALLKVGIFHIFLAYTLEFWALQFLSAGKTALLFSLYPFLTALLMRILCAERLHAVQWVGLLLACAGSVPLLVKDGDMLISSFSLPEVALLGSIISAAYGWILVKKLVTETSLSPVIVNGIGMAIGGGLCSMVALCTESGLVRVADPFSAQWYQFLFAGLEVMGLLIIIANIVSYNLYGFLFKKYSPTLLGLSGIMIPIFTIVYGYFFLNEPIPLALLPGSAIMAIGLAIFYSKEIVTPSSVASTNSIS